MAKLLIAHGGAPTAVINASMCGAISAAKKSGLVSGILGARHGSAGILKEQFIDLGALDDWTINALRASPGSAIGTSRTPLQAEDYAQMARILRKNDVDYLLFTGGNGSMDACAKLSAVCAGEGIVVGGIPKTIDNDIGLIDHAPGYGSAARFAACTMRQIVRDVRSMPIHVCIVEYMGRNAGWLTAASALAGQGGEGAPDMILLPETPFDEARFLARVNEIWARGRGVVVAVSEGARRADGSPIAPPVFTSGRATYFGEVSGYLARLVIEKLKIKARSEKPGILGRCCAEMVSPLDRAEAERMGALAAETALKGLGGLMAGLRRVPGARYACEEILVPAAEVALSERMLPREYIAPDGFGVTDAFLQWARPLLGGELPVCVSL